MKLNLTALLAVTALSIAATSARAAHVYGGIIDTNGTPGLQAGDALSFVSTSTAVGAPTPGSVVTGPSMGVQPMELVTTGAQAGLFITTGISFTGLSNGKNWTGTAYRPSSPFAATGGNLQLTIIGITGPDGAEFALWGDSVTDVFMIEDGMFHVHEGDGAWALTDKSLIVGDGVTPSPTGVNNTNPPLDPYGHIHGRSISVDTPGDYTVTYVLKDTTGTYADSAPFVVSYTAAVPEPSTIALLAGAGIGALVLRKRSRKSA
jgi:hypothetical protein